MATYFVFMCFVVVLMNLLSSYSVDTEDGCSGRQKYSLKKINIPSRTEIREGQNSI